MNAPLNTSNVISFRRLADAIRYYESIEYTYVEVPWVAPAWAIDLTYSHVGLSMLGKDQYFVGSAEQSFIALTGEGKLPRGRYVTCTPCIRPGDDRDSIHQPAFMKVELFRTDIVDLWAVDEVIFDAMEFFSQQLAGLEYVLERADDKRENCDINLNGIEVGSYGIRTVGNVVWVYGTGVAEPRFQQALSATAANHPAYVEFQRTLHA